MTGKDSQITSKESDIKPKENIEPKSSIPIEKVYRRRHLGKEKLSWITADGVHHGFKATKIYGKVKDDEGKYVDDMNVVIGEKKDFTNDYSESKAKEIMDTAFKTCQNPKFYLVDSPEKFGFRNPQDNFLGKFDELLTKFRDGKTL